MNRKQIIRIIIDICMTICLLVLMAYSLVGEKAHEWIGMAMLILFVTHHILNRKWIAGVFKGKYTLFRIIQTILVIVMLVLMAGSMVSGILLSEYLFKLLKIFGISEIANRIHIFCAYWGFVIMSLHLGFHWNMVVGMISRKFKKTSMLRRWLVRLPIPFLAANGIYVFYKRQIGSYLLMKMHFVFYDFGESVITYIFDYMAAMILIAVIGYYFGLVLRKNSLRKR